MERVRSLRVPRDQAKAACQRSSAGTPGFAAWAPQAINRLAGLPFGRRPKAANLLKQKEGTPWN